MRAAVLLFALLTFGCQSESESPEDETEPGETEPADTTSSQGADVVTVSWEGEPGVYTFTVTLRSPDVDCTRYADWWEVLTDDGALVYRRILNHSHADEQPFARSGEEMDVLAADPLVVRGHVNDFGYGGLAFTGSVAEGFTANESITADFAAEVESLPPQVEDCWW